METIGQVLLIIGLVLLAVFFCYEVFALTRDIIRRVKAKKSKSKDNVKSVDNTEKGE